MNSKKNKQQLGMSEEIVTFEPISVLATVPQLTSHSNFAYNLVPWLEITKGPFYDFAEELTKKHSGKLVPTYCNLACHSELQNAMVIRYFFAKFNRSMLKESGVILKIEFLLGAEKWLTNLRIARSACNLSRFINKKNHVMFNAKIFSYASKSLYKTMAKK